MAGGLAATSDVNRIEAPVTWKAYLVRDITVHLHIKPN